MLSRIILIVVVRALDQALEKISAVAERRFAEENLNTACLTNPQMKDVHDLGAVDLPQESQDQTQTNHRYRTPGEQLGYQKNPNTRHKATASFPKKARGKIGMTHIVRYTEVLENV